MAITDTQQTAQFAASAAVSAAEAKQYALSIEKPIIDIAESVDEAKNAAIASGMYLDETKDIATGLSARIDFEISEKEAEFESQMQSQRSEFELAQQTKEDAFLTSQVQMDSDFNLSQTEKEDRFQQFLISSGYVFLGGYEDGPFQFSARNQYIRYNNQYYRLNAATDVGFITTGTTAASFANDVTHFVLMDGDTLRSNLGSGEPGMGVDLVHGARRYFKVTDYTGGYPNSTVTRNSDGSLTIAKGTNNTSAIKSAIADAQTCNGVVYFPAPVNGKAYLFDETLFPAVTTGALWRGASLLGDGKTSTKLIFDGGDKPAVHVKGTSGWPTNIFLQGISLFSANDFLGEGWKLQGITGIRLTDFAAYRFGEGGLSISNGSAPGIFTEFNIIEDGWLENNKANVKFRKDGGDGSFHGITLRNVISNNISGQTGLDVGAGCVIYNADWEQVTFFGSVGVQWILNNGARNGFETLYFEGDGTVTNNASWSTAGYWRIQNGTGVITDTSTIPFFNDGYITPTSPLDANFSAAGFTSLESLKPLISSQAYRGLMRLRGNNAEAIAVTGFDSGPFESQGLAIVSQSLGDGVKDIILRQLLHLNGITSFRPEYRFNYIGGNTQLSINSGGRHTGVMGRRTTGNISANASQQTITTNLALPITNQTFMLSVHLYSADGTHRHVATYVGAAVTGSVASTALLITSHSDSAIAFPSASFVILDGGILRFAVTTSVDISYEIKALGVGTY